MPDRSSGCPEEDEVPGSGFLALPQPPAGPHLPHGVPWQSDSLLGQNLLGETGAIEARRRTPAPVIGNTQERGDPLEQTRTLVWPGQRPTREPAAAAVRQLDTAPRTAAPRDDHATVEEQGTDEHAVTRPGPHLGGRHTHPRAGLRHPGHRPRAGHEDESPLADPAAVAVRHALDVQPGAAAPAPQDEDDLTQQELAGELPAVPGPPSHVQVGGRDDSVGEPGPAPPGSCGSRLAVPPTAAARDPTGVAAAPLSGHRCDPSINDAFSHGHPRFPP